ncbi:MULTISPECIES: DUF3082 domain-containing protein [Aphanothece]|uniref:DUF3082 domain-containing protein n=1 Tax=Aphanothece TaxID=1121 RepID=UPI003985006B
MNDPRPSSAMGGTASDPAADEARGTQARATASEPPRKGPLSYLSGALTAGLLGWLCLGLSQRTVLYYGAHPPHYSSAVAQSIATAVKTLLVGMVFLATFSFGFIALGLTLVFVRSLLPGSSPERAGAEETP